MRRVVLRLLAILLVALTCCLPALAQAPRNGRQQADPNAEQPQRPFVALPYAVGVVAVILVMVVVCMPSRKHA